MVQGHVTSRDGTRIGYLRQGSGPSLVLVQGAMATAYSYRELASKLSSNFTIYIPDRRGRGLSPRPYSSDHTISQDVEDIAALLKASGARRVFGLSSSAKITLEAARTLPLVTKAAVYEPPFYPDGISRDGILQLNAEIERGDLAAALVSALRVAGTAPAPLRRLPRPLAKLAAAVLHVEGRRHGSEVALRELLPGVRYDFNVVADMDGKMATFAAAKKPVLLLSGTKSPAYLRHSVRELAGMLPNARRVAFKGLGHAGP